VNSVHPGSSRRRSGSPSSASAIPEPTRPRPRRHVGHGVPLGVKGLPKDIAQGVLWLASEESRYVTGAELVIDGGLSVR